MTTKKWPAAKTAEFLDISERHLHRLVAEGILPAAGAGGFDALAVVRAFLLHVKSDAEGRQARAALAKAQTLHRTVKTKSALGELVTLAELQSLSDDLWSGVWSAWTLAAAYFYEHIGYLPGVDADDQLRVAGHCDQAGKAQLIHLRDTWAARLRGERVRLRDDDRINALLGSIAEDDHVAQ